jgi:hypothetical protein
LSSNVYSVIDTSMFSTLNIKISEFSFKVLKLYHTVFELNIALYCWAGNRMTYIQLNFACL